MCVCAICYARARSNRFPGTKRWNSSVDWITSLFNFALDSICNEISSLSLVSFYFMHIDFEWNNYKLEATQCNDQRLIQTINVVRSGSRSSYSYCLLSIWQCQTENGARIFHVCRYKHKSVILISFSAGNGWYGDIEMTIWGQKKN